MRNLILVALLLGGCKEDTAASMDMAVDLASNSMPSAPTLGVQIDRMGRPAINTALNNTFHPDDTIKGAAKDSHNAEGNEANWPTVLLNNKPALVEYAANLAILDGLDGTCGNQLLAAGGGGDAGAMGYTALAGVLIDDELFVDTAKSDCKPATMVSGLTLPNYLAVEGRFLGLPFPTCGGRTPLDDTIDVTLTVLAVGLGTPVGDGISSDTDQATPPSLTEFPFLRGPN